MRDMYWDCGTFGCLKDQKIPKLGVFDDCFSGKMGLGDLDGFLLRNGKMLFLEFKEVLDEVELRIPTGQHIAFEEISRDFPARVICAGHYGAINKFDIRAISVYHKGIRHDLKEPSYDKLREAIQRTSRWMES